MKKLTKIEEFQQNLRLKILLKEINNNTDAYNFVLNEGHVCSHAAECLKEMKKNGEINFDGTSPLVTYENVYKNKKIVEYKIIQK